MAALKKGSQAEAAWYVVMQNDVVTKARRMFHTFSISGRCYLTFLHPVCFEIRSVSVIPAASALQPVRRVC